MSCLGIGDVLLTDESLTTLLQLLTSLNELELIADERDTENDFCEIRTVDEVFNLMGSCGVRGETWFSSGGKYRILKSQ